MKSCTYKAKAKNAFVKTHYEDKERYKLWLELGRPCYYGFKAFCQDHDIRVASVDTIEQYKDCYIYENRID